VIKTEFFAIPKPAISYLSSGRLLAALLICVVTSALQAQQKLIPLNRFYQREIERSTQHDTTQRIHFAARPLLESSVNCANVYGFARDTTKYYTKEATKLFRDHLFMIRKDDFFLALDPLFDFTIGKDFADTTYFKTQEMLTNQRGVQLIGDIGKKFSFQTSFYETQIVVPVYLKNYCDSTGIFPGWGRTKDFNQRGYDFGVSTGWISYSPIKNLNLQFGQGKSFYGHGYRSILWSDAAFNTPYIKATASLAEGRLQYSSMYATLQTLNRLPPGEVPEALFIRKGASVNYLSWIPAKGVEIGLFESVIWQLYDTAGTKPPAWGAYLPLPMLNTALLGLDDLENAMVGLNARITIGSSTALYGQFALDSKKHKSFGWQAGAKFFDAFIPRLDIQFEWNTLSNFMYASTSQVQSYSHFNQPVGHPTGGATEELLLIFNYRYKRFFAQLKLNQIYHSIGPDGLWSANPEIPQINIAAWPQKNIFQADAECGFFFNPKTNFQILAGYTNRTDTTDYNWTEDVKLKTSFFYISIRTNLINRYADF
jgi:hypothetical protein